MDVFFRKVRMILTKRYRFKHFKFGFTLVELLAVIVILAIIMLIAIPSVLGTLTTAKRKSFIEYVDKIFLTTQKQVMEEDINGNTIVGCRTFYIKKDLGLSNTGNYDGFVLVKNDGFNEISYYITMHDDEYKIDAYLYNGLLDINNLDKWSNNDKLVDDNACLAAGCSSCASSEDLTGDDVCPTLPDINDSTPRGFSGSGTENDPYLIESIDDLVYLSEKTNDGTLGDNKYYKLVNDLSFDCDKSYVDTSLKNTLTSGTGFTPIGFGSNFFKSSFDGNNKKIYGLYMNDSSKEYAGFIGTSYFTGKNKYVVKNLSILDADVTLGGDAGIVIGKIYYYGSDGGYIENIKTSGKIRCSGYCGGIAGEIEGENKNYYAKNLVNKADINSSYYYTGGIFGKSSYINVTNSTNYGNIKSTSSYVGGVIGSAYTRDQRYDGEIRNLENHGNIEVKGSQVGGVIGSAQKYDIYDLKNYGEINIIEGTYTGGVLGELNYDTKVYNAYNYNKIKGKSRRIGGITGYMSGDSLLYNAYNYGDVEFITNDSTDTDFGGIVANLQNGFVMNCGNHGNVISNNSGSIGGIIGYSYTYATNCYNYGNIINKQFGDYRGQDIGGLVGTGSIKNSYNIGDIILDTSKYNGTDNYVGLLIGDPNGNYSSSNLFAVGNITDNNAFGSNGNHYGVLFGGSYNVDNNFYVKGNISNLKYVNLDTSGYDNGYADIYSDAHEFKSYNDMSTKDPGIHYNLNNSPNKATINLTEEYDFSKVNGMWFRDTLKLGNNWKYQDGLYPKLYKVLPNGTITNELVEGQKDIAIK